jgi:hypothetical protein
MRTTVPTIVVLSLLALASCKSATGEGDLRGSLPAQDVRGYLYSKVENNSQSSEALTNPDVVDLTPQPRGTSNVVIGYKRVTDNAARTTHTYKTEARRAGDDVALVVTDVDTEGVVLDTRFPPAEPHAPGAPVFDSLQACINDFLCKNQSALLCEANRTCRDQLWALTCCLSNGQCFSVHGVVRPTTLRCQVVGPITDLEAIVFSR